jgi:gamma-glutamylcyclotransferase (GGCT)/AIG2-like uncharacterized protein YtfP
MRTPSCACVDRARLPGHTLRFHKRSRLADDRSGKCNAHATGDEHDVIHGVVYRISLHEQAALDHAEGEGRGYDRVSRTVVYGTSVLEAQTYLAQEDWIDETLRPFDWYLALVSSGARIQGLPRLYQKTLRSVEAWSDPDRRRADRHFALARGTGVITAMPARSRG